MLAPQDTPLYRSRAERFDDLVLQAVAQLEPRWEAELSGIEFAVEEIPAAGAPDDVPGPGAAGPAGPRLGRSAAIRAARPAPPRIVLYRRPLMARADGEEELGELVLDVVVEEFARLLGLDPQGGRSWLPGGGLSRRRQRQGRHGRSSESRAGGSGTAVSVLSTGKIDSTVPPWASTRPA